MTTETAPLSAVRVEPVVGRLTALDEACYANEEAEKELAQLRADADRYRYLRDRWPEAIHVRDMVVGMRLTEDYLDGAIDTAMAYETPNAGNHGPT